MPRRAKANGGGSREAGTQVGEVSEVWLPGRDRACVCKMCSVTRTRETSSGAGPRRLGDIQPTVADIQSCNKVRTKGVGVESLLARRRAAPRRCIRVGREQEGQGECIYGPRGSRWRRAPGGHGSVGGGAAALLRWGGGVRMGRAFRGHGAEGRGWGRCMECRGRRAAGRGGQWCTWQRVWPRGRLCGRHGASRQTLPALGGAGAAWPGAGARRTWGAGATGDKGRRPYVFGEGGTNLKSVGGGTLGGPWKEDRGRELPARGVPDIPRGDGLRVPTAPSTDGGQGRTGNAEGGCPHPTETVPSEGGPGGTGEQGVQGLLEVLFGRGKRATGVGGRSGEGGQSRGPSGSPRTEGHGDPGAGNLLVKEGD